MKRAWQFFYDWSEAFWILSIALMYFGYDPIAWILGLTAAGVSGWKNG